MIDFQTDCIYMMSNGRWAPAFSSLLAFCLPLLLVEPAWAQQESAQPLKGQRLDTLLLQSESVQLASLNLLNEIFITETSILFPQTDLFVVMLAQDYGAQILLQKLELMIDGSLVKTHHFNGHDMERLMDRGEQTIHTSLLAAGHHTLGVKLYGLGFLQGPMIEGDFSLKKGAQPHFVELSISGKAMRFNEWR
jgi:hypothetical protein